VKDAGGNLLSGITVTFTAPGTAATGAFGGLSTVTAVTNASGLATASTLTANGQAGSYSVVASVAGVTAPATFTLTNLAAAAAAPASVVASAGTPQLTAVNSAFPVPLQATVKDASGNLLSGITVMFIAPGTGVTAAFGGLYTVTAVTNAGGLATAPTLTANGQAGSYPVFATVVGVPAPATFTLTNAPAASSGSGSLSASATSLASPVNLTIEGTTDWVHWGDSTLNRKANVTPQISGYSIIGSGSAITYNNDPRPISWTDGSSPATSTSNLDGLFMSFVGNGFSFTAPADGNIRKLTVHVGGWMGGGTFTAHLSDGSAPDFTDTTSPAYGQFDRNYTVIYNAASPGQTLKITWVDSSGGGNVTLNAAALQ